MASSFSIIGMLLENARKAEARQTAERPKSAAQRERERAELRADMAWGTEQARKFAERQAAEADPEAARLAHDKAMALLIVQAGARARGLPVPTHLIQDGPLSRFADQEQSPVYPDKDNYNSPGDPTDPDDEPNPKDKRGKKVKKAKDKNHDEDDENEETADDSGEETEAQYQERCRATALAICNAGRRRRGLPLLSKLEQDR